MSRSPDANVLESEDFEEAAEDASDARGRKRSSFVDDEVEEEEEDADNEV